MRNAKPRLAIWCGGGRLVLSTQPGRSELTSVSVFQLYGYAENPSVLMSVSHGRKVFVSKAVELLKSGWDLHCKFR